MTDDTRDVIARALFEMDSIEPPVDRCHPIWHNYLTDAEAILAALAAKGLGIFPLEATEAMQAAAESADLSSDGPLSYAALWSAMIAAGGDDG